MSAGNNIATYGGAVFLCGGSWNKIIHSTLGHTHICSCRMLVKRSPKCTETEVCRQFAKAVALVPVGFGNYLLLHFTGFIAFFTISVLYIK